MGREHLPDELNGAWWWVAFRDAALVVVVCMVGSLAYNALRQDGIPIVQKNAYQILVPCPETKGEATEITPDSGLLQAPKALIIDARKKDAFEKWQMPGAVNIPFDYLEPTPQAEVDRTVASGAQKVIVYGDGATPDTGEQLARELAGRGVRNLYFVRGGAPALLAVGRKGVAP